MTAREIFLRVLKPVFLAAALPLYVLIRFLEPWRRVVLGLLPYERIGHLASNTEVFLRRRAADPQGARLLPLFVSGPPANEQLLRMISRRVWVGRSAFSRRLVVDGLLPLVRGTRFHEPFAGEAQDSPGWADIKPQLSFTKEEERRGRRILETMGIPPGAAFVCLHTRDKAYLDRVHAYRSRAEWSYHDYRDCDINDFMPAAEKLARAGCYVLRMGSVVEKPVTPPHPKVIDYAVKHRSDFGDVYLTARCRFFLSSDSGLANVPAVFGAPHAFSNVVPLDQAPAGRPDLLIYKLYRDARTGKLVPFRRIIESGAGRFLRSEKFREAGLELVDNTPEELIAFSDEMLARLDGTWKAQEGDEDLQRRFRALMPAAYPMSRLPARVGAHFLRAHRDLLD